MKLLAASLLLPAAQAFYVVPFGPHLAIQKLVDRLPNMRSGISRDLKAPFSTQPKSKKESSGQRGGEVALEDPLDSQLKVDDTVLRQSYTLGLGDTGAIAPH